MTAHPSLHAQPFERVSYDPGSAAKWPVRAQPPPQPSLQVHATPIPRKVLGGL